MALGTPFSIKMDFCYFQVRPSVTFMISEPCTCCHGTGRVEALDTSFSKIEREICRRLVSPIGFYQYFLFVICVLAAVSLCLITCKYLLCKINMIGRFDIVVL